jgi:hypothetical protein
MVHFALEATTCFLNKSSITLREGLSIISWIRALVSSILFTDSFVISITKYIGKSSDEKRPSLVNKPVEDRVSAPTLLHGIIRAHRWWQRDQKETSYET